MVHIASYMKPSQGFMYEIDNSRYLSSFLMGGYGKLFGLLLEWKIPMNTLKVNFKVQSNWS